MNIPSTNSLISRSRRASLSLKNKNLSPITIPTFSNLADTHAAPSNRKRNLSLSSSQMGSQIKFTKSSRAVQHSSRNLVSLKETQEAISYMSFKDLLKNNIQKSNANANAKLSNYEVKIRVFSNYGHENLITSGEIDILDQNQATIRNITCSVSSIILDKNKNIAITVDKNNELPVIDENEEVSNNNAFTQPFSNEDTSSRLVNQQIIKNSIEETWIHKWEGNNKDNKSEEKLIDIILNFKSQEKPLFVRIFPSPFIPEANLNSIQVYINEKLMHEGTLNQTFCSVIELHYDEGCATDLSMYIKSEDKNMPHVLRDQFGILPFCFTKEISISIIESSSKKPSSDPNLSNSSFVDPNDQSLNSIMFGIRKIAFFTTAGEMVKPDSMEIASKNIKCYQPLPQLFTDEITTANSQPWKGAFIDDNEFLITFKNPLPIAAIGILSPSVHTTLRDIRVKKIAVKVNGVMRWVGKIFNHLNNSYDRNDEDDFPFYLYLTNHDETRKAIPKYFS